MAIGKFDETSEKNETNETKEATDNNEKRRNQILDTPEDYDDDFDKKLDETEKHQDGMKENSEKGEKNDFFSKFKDKFDEIKDRFSKKDNTDDKSESKEETDKKVTGNSTDAEKAFRNSYKVDNSNNQIEKNAHTSMDTKRALSEGENDEDDNLPDSVMTPSTEKVRKPNKQIEDDEPEL